MFVLSKVLSHLQGDTTGILTQIYHRMLYFLSRTMFLFIGVGKELRKENIFSCVVNVLISSLARLLF